MNKSLFRLLLFTLIAAAISFRLIFFLLGLRHLPISTDEAWPALMGLHVLNGEFPVFYWGQNYMGSQQAFFDAFTFMLFGVNPFAARVYPLLFSFLYVAATCLLARRLYGREISITTLALLMIPVPYLTMAGTLSVPPEYLPLTAMGSWALVLLARIVLKSGPECAAPCDNFSIGRVGQPSPTESNGGPGCPALPFWKFLCMNDIAKTTAAKTIPSFFLLGLLLGFMFWLHIVAISFIAVVLVFVFLRDKLCFLRPVFWLSLLAFFIGGFPFWWFNFTHDFITFADMVGTGDWHSAWKLCCATFGISLHFLVGMKVMLYGDSRQYVSLPDILAIILGLSYCCLIVIVIIAHFRGMLSWLRWRAIGTDGTAILLSLAVLILYFFCRSERSSWDSVRFMLPIMSALPILLACGLEQVKKWNRYIFVFLLIIVISAQAWGNFLLYREWSDPEIVGRKLELPDTAGLHRFLREHNIRYAYAHYWISYRIIFESQEKLICAEPFNERFPGRPVQYLDEVHAASNVAFITHSTLSFVPNFESHLLALGGTYHKTSVGAFTVFYDVVPPYGKNTLREIKRDGWRFTADQRPDLLNLLTDDNPKTRWETGKPQKAGEQITIDMNRVEKICKMRFNLADVESDTPNGYSLEVSLDGKEWKKVYESGAVAEGFFWENDQPWMYVGNNFFTAAFAPIECKYIRMTLATGHPRYWWSIGELQIFGPE